MAGPTRMNLAAHQPRPFSRAAATRLLNPNTEVDDSCSSSKVFDIRPSYRRNKIIAGGSCPPLVAEAQQIEHDDEHEHDSLTSESGLNRPGSLFYLAPAAQGGAYPYGAKVIVIDRRSPSCCLVLCPHTRLAALANSTESGRLILL
jgi:hypothetical protein